jgi:hypothetical protein
MSPERRNGRKRSAGRVFGARAGSNLECDHLPSLSAVAEADDGDLAWIRSREVAHEIIDFSERVVLFVEGSVGGRYDVPPCPRLTCDDVGPWCRWRVGA